MVSWWSPGRHMSQESDFSICPSLKQKSAAQQSQFGSKHLPQIHACLGRSPHSSIRSFLKPFPPAYMAATSLQTARHLLPYYPRPHGRKKTPSLHPFKLCDCFPLLSAHPYSKCSAWNFLCDFTSSPSYDVLLLPVPPYLLLSFGCHL